MSVSKLSLVLQSKIMDGLIASIQRDIATAGNTRQITFGNFNKEVKITAEDVTRILADKRQVGIFSQQALNDLANAYNNLSAEKLKKSRIFTSTGKVKPSFKNIYEYIKASSDLDTALNTLAQNAATLFNSPNLYSEFLEYVSAKGKLLQESDGTLQLRVGTHRAINRLFGEYLTSKNHPAHLIEFINSTTDAGHLLGIFNQKLYRAFVKSSNSNETFELGELEVNIFESSEKLNDEMKHLNTTFSAAFNLMEYIDFLTSSLKKNPKLFAKLSKLVYGGKRGYSAAEIQASFENSEIGRELRAAGLQLKKIIESAETASFRTLDGSTTQMRDPRSVDFAKNLELLFKSIGNTAEIAKSLAQNLESAEDKQLQELSKKIAKKSGEFGQILLNAEGSDSLKTSIGKTIALTIAGKKLPTEDISSVNAKRVSKPPVGTAKKIPKSTKSFTVKNTLSKIRTKIPVQTQRKTLNLINLQNLINASLIERVKQNMGRGERRDVLNLRTGRFAESVKVERMSQSREGMITAFYSYMKNPYATFSKGGRQDSPTSRDPKLLIAKSIREIAATQVANRLRSVSI